MQLDAYQQSLVDAYKDLGFNVHIILSNLMTQHFIHGINENITDTKLIGLIKEIDPELIIQMNNGGLKSSLKLELKIPVVNIIVDEVGHLFIPEFPLFENIIDQYTQLAVGDTKTYQYLKNQIPASLKDHIHLIPSAGGKGKNLSNEYKHNISFVGSFLDIGQAKKLFMEAIFYDDDTISRLLIASTRLSKDFEHDFSKTVEELKLMPLLESQNISPDYLKHILSNYISSTIRIETLSKIAPLGLSLFGNNKWGRAILSDKTLINCYQSEQLITSSEQLMEVYNTSKISINISQIQVSTGLAYRVYDILKSRSLLIIPFHSNSDAFKFFGDDCPIPMYKSLDHLYELCDYYLSHEEERAELVKKCNKLVEKNFSFIDRAQGYLKISNFKNEENKKVQKGKEFNISLQDISQVNFSLNIRPTLQLYKFKLNLFILRILSKKIIKKWAKKIIFNT